MKNFIRSSFRRELLVCFIVAALVPLVCSSAFLVQVLREKISGDYQKKTLEQLTQIEETLDAVIEDFQHAAEELSADPEIINALQLQKGTPNMRSGVYSKLYGATAELRETAVVELYSSEGICEYTTGVGNFHRMQPAYWGVLKVAAAHPGELIIRREKTYQDQKVCLRAARAVYNEKDECVGFVLFAMNEANFDAILKSACGMQEGISILNNFMETMYSTGIGREENIGQVIRQRILDGKPVQEDYHDYSISIAKLKNAEIYTVYVTPVVLTDHIVESMYSVIGMLAILSVMLCILVAAWMSKQLCRPVQILNDAMSELQKGRMDTRVSLNRSDELGQLSESFNIMAKELNGYMEQQVSQQKKMNDIQIAMMQAQLNPHFLYNTLDTMKWVAKANHIPELATLSSKLAKILRTSISNEPFITLSEEIALVKSYAEIQRIRFDGKFELECEVPEELHTCMIPKLIVQPIVENAVIHGLSECREGSIEVSAQKKQERLFIMVRDNGCGMEKQLVELLNQRSWDKISGHIGLYNVDTIIRLYYGPDYGLHIECPKQGGTQVSIELPVRWG